MKKYFLFSIIVFSALWFWGFATAQSEFTCQKYVDNGVNSSKINVFILGNDIQPSDFTAFAEKEIDKNGTGIGFFSVEPFKTYKDRFNFYTLTPSSRTITFPSGETWDTRIQRFKQLAVQYCSVSESDVDEMVVDTYKDSTTHMSGVASLSGHIAFVKTPSASDTVTMDNYMGQLFHEFGHSFAGFGEEYSNYGTAGVINLDSEGCLKWCSGMIGTNSNYYLYYKEWSDCVAGVKAGAQQITLPTGAVDYIFTAGERVELATCYHMPAQKLWVADKEILLAANLGTNCLAGTGCYLHMPDDIRFRQMYGSLMGKATLGGMLLLLNMGIPLTDPMFSDFSYISSSDYSVILNKYKSICDNQNKTYGAYSEKYLTDLIKASSVASNYAPFGTLDYAYASHATGWAYDQDAGSSPIVVHIYVDGIFAAVTTANTYRPDVAAALSGLVNGDYHGFDSYYTNLSVGTHTVRAYAINTPAGNNVELWGSPKTVIVGTADTTPPAAPTGVTVQ